MISSLSSGAASAAGLLAILFVAALLTHLLIELWLGHRQMRHVQAHRNSVPAPFRQNITLAAHQKAADYTVASLRFGWLESIWSGILVLGWTFGGGLQWLNQTLQQWLGYGFLQQLVLLLAFGAIAAMLAAPWGFYKTFQLEDRFGFNRMTLKLWVTDGLRSLLVGALLGVPLIAAILWLMQAAGNLWWLWAWGLWMSFNILMMWLFPTFIAPLFNQFKPLDDEALKQRILALMQRSGFASQGLFVMDGSKRSAHANAYFTGFGSAKRVVFFDTLLRKLNTDEVEAVLAHELGHFKHQHIRKRMLSFFILSLVGFALLGWLIQQSWFFLALGVQPITGESTGNSANNAIALILFAMLAEVFMGFFRPFSSQLSRKHEFEADAYAVQQTGGHQHLSAALLKLYEDNASTLTPDPLYARFHYSHPPATERLEHMQTISPAATTS